MGIECGFCFILSLSNLVTIRSVLAFSILNSSSLENDHISLSQFLLVVTPTGYIIYKKEKGTCIAISYIMQGVLIKSAEIPSQNAVNSRS